MAQDAKNRIITIPILFGGKLTGKTGKFELGLMNAQTRSKNTIAGENFSVARIKYQILSRSYIGLIATSRLTKSNFDNSAIGADANIFISEDTGVSGFASTTASRGESHGNLNSSAFNITLFKRGERTSFNLALTDIGGNFNPKVGFLTRSDVRKWNGELKIPLYVESKKIRRLVPEYKVVYFVNHDEKIENS
ncbi:MAG: hypothetical protein GY797_35870, partial [Deltaproteobacteria bacterium]|nr:hypothetical protein [Deltaproteobacteria bacterium]